MAISVKKEQLNEKDKITIELDNGHSEALSKIIKDYNLIGEKEAIIFMLSVFANAEGRAVKIGEASFVPSEKIKKPPVAQNQ